LVGRTEENHEKISVVILSLGEDMNTGPLGYGTGLSLTRQRVSAIIIIIIIVGRDSSVGIATRYGLDGPAIEFQGGRDFPHPSRPALRPNQLPIQ